MPAAYGSLSDLGRAASTVFPNLKPSTESISLRLPVSVLGELKRQAAKRDVPYQSYLKTLLADALDARRGR